MTYHPLPQPWETGVDDTSAESWATPGAVIDKIDRALDDAPTDKCPFTELLIGDLRDITRHLRGIHPEWWQS